MGDRGDGAWGCAGWEVSKKEMWEGSPFSAPHIFLCHAYLPAWYGSYTDLPMA